MRWLALVQFDRHLCFLSAQTHGDEGIYWQVNFERFHLYFRDQAIISAVANKLDQVRSNSFLWEN